MFFKPVSPEFPWPACLSGPRTLCPTCLSALQFLEPYRQWEILIFDPSFATDCENALMLYICTLSFICCAFTFPLLPCPDDFWDRHCLSGAAGEPDVVIVDIACWNSSVFFCILQKPLESFVKYQQSSFLSPHCWRMQASSLPLKSLKKGRDNL